MTINRVWIRGGESAEMLVSKQDVEVTTADPLDLVFDSRFGGLTLLAKSSITVLNNGQLGTYYFGVTLPRPPIILYYCNESSIPSQPAYYSNDVRIGTGSHDDSSFVYSYQDRVTVRHVLTGGGNWGVTFYFAILYRPE